jgi:hypothetical protein
MWRTRERPIRIGAVVALALAVGFVVWLLVRGNDSSSSAPATTPTPPPAKQATGTKPVRTLLTAATPAKLRALSRSTGQPIYWAGSRPNATYELTRSTNGQIFVRYLPQGVRLGERKSAYLFVATYPVQDAYKAVKTVAKESGAVTFKAPGGGLAVYNQSAPKNVYLAYPGSSYQVEVFDPHPGRARKLVRTGAIRSVG